MVIYIVLGTLNLISHLYRLYSSEELSLLSYVQLVSSHTETRWVAHSLAGCLARDNYLGIYFCWYHIVLIGPVQYPFCSHLFDDSLYPTGDPNRGSFGFLSAGLYALACLARLW